VAKRRSVSSNDAVGDDPSVASESEPEEAADGPSIRDVETAVRRAEEELKQARQWYQEVRQQATDQVKRLRESTCGDLTRSTLKLVRRHPGPGVLIAMLIGFFLGRLFRR
jgi:ElaB/YqjD/DUF883 family membrane-anchored ribosome-binding protein